MKLRKIKKGIYEAIDTCCATDRVIIEHDTDTGYWYAYDAKTGQSVCDSERTLSDIKERIS